MVGTVSAVTTLGGVVLSVLRGTEVAYEQVEATTVPSVFAGSVWRAYSCQSGHVWLGMTPPHSSGGWDGREVVNLSCVVQLRQKEGSRPTLALVSGLFCLARLGFGHSGLR
jgi:hypothetical protein